MKHLLPLTMLALCLLLAGAGCKSAPQVIPQDLSPAEYFQRGQEASDAGRYSFAMQIYRQFQTQYPEERDRQLWAKYEIALLQYKMGETQTALEGFDALLQEYAAAAATPPEGGPLPDGPRILAEKLKSRIVAETAEAAEQAKP